MAAFVPFAARRLPRVVVLGSGWSGFALLSHLSPRAFDVVCISPRNHMLFTPLLASSAVGTIDFRSLAEPLDAALPHVAHVRAHATGLDAAARAVLAAPEADDPRGAAAQLRVEYDLLVVAVGARPSSFGVPGVAEHALFLKELADARAIRQRILRNVAAATMPDTTPAQARALLSFVVVGGGPTGVEFAGELDDYLREDVLRLHPHLRGAVRITLLEAGPAVLSSFDASLQAYALRRYASRRIEVRTHTKVVRVARDAVELEGGELLPSHLVVWNTGIGPSDFARGLREEDAVRDSWGHFQVDERLRAPPAPASSSSSGVAAAGGSGVGGSRVWAIGDAEAVAGARFAATAQVAEQQGAWLAGELNSAAARAGAARLAPAAAAEAVAVAMNSGAPFTYRHRGSLAALGRFAAAADFSKTELAPAAAAAGAPGAATIGGFGAFLIWRGAYVTKLGSLRNKIQVPMDWLRTLVFGRDTTTF